jgi:hypothetical protein
MVPITNGRTVNDKVRECGVIALVDLAGDKLWFFPRGRLPAYLVAYLNIHEGRNARLLRDFVVTLGRGIITD